MNPTITNRFESLTMRDVRMWSFEEKRIVARLLDDTELEFLFPNREQMDAAIERWVRQAKHKQRMAFEHRAQMSFQ